MCWVTARWIMKGKRTPEQSAYKDAKARCSNPNNPRWKDYGGRGIKFLFNNFEQFLAELGRRPSTKHSLDRKNNDGNYEPGNVRWSTAKEQASNRRLPEDLVGRRFGRLLVISLYERGEERGRKTKWLCRCDCGQSTIVKGTNLKNSTRSCGCLRRELMRSPKFNPRMKNIDYPEPITR